MKKQEIKELSDRDWLLIPSSKYFKLYNKIIDKAKMLEEIRLIDADNYYETHHIIPVSLGGDNVDDNLVILTQREHYLCHYLLTKFTIGSDYKKMVLAFAHSHTGSSHQKRFHKNRILYEANNRRHRELIKGRGNPMYGKKRPDHSENMKGSKNPFYAKTHTEETKEKISLSNKGRLVSEKNPSSKVWILTSPEGKIFKTKGNIRSFCEELDISFQTLRKSLGKIVEYNRFARGQKFKNTIGWKLETE